MFGIRLTWAKWFLLLIVFYMAIVSPSTLGLVFTLIDRVFIAVANGITHFLDSAIK
jgi:hypothetical protein